MTRLCVCWIDSSRLIWRKCFRLRTVNSKPGKAVEWRGRPEKIQRKCLLWKREKTLAQITTEGRGGNTRSPGLGPLGSVLVVLVGVSAWGRGLVTLSSSMWRWTAAVTNNCFLLGFYFVGSLRFRSVLFPFISVDNLMSVVRCDILTVLYFYDDQTGRNKPVEGFSGTYNV